METALEAQSDWTEQSRLDRLVSNTASRLRETWMPACAGMPAMLGLTARSANSARALPAPRPRSEEHTSELQSLMRISYAVFCLQIKIILYPNSNCSNCLHTVHKPLRPQI